MHIQLRLACTDTGCTPHFIPVLTTTRTHHVPVQALLQLGCGLPPSTPASTPGTQLGSRNRALDPLSPSQTQPRRRLKRFKRGPKAKEGKENKEAKGRGKRGKKARRKVADVMCAICILWYELRPLLHIIYIDVVCVCVCVCVTV